jgi:putative DNA-invertase from lambdoid prophage Rac
MESSGENAFWDKLLKENTTMGVYGYIFLAPEKEYTVPLAEQQNVLLKYVSSLGLRIDEFFIERESSLKRALRERKEGGRMYQNCGAGDSIFVMKVEWVLGSAGDGSKLLRVLRKNGVALYCVDLDGNISLDEKRKLMVSDGIAVLVQQLLAGLAVCETSKHGEAIRVAKRTRKKEGKYLGGPVPFGWKVNANGFLVQDKEQQKVILAIEDMRKDRWSYRDISRKLKEEFDVHISHEGVRRILKNKKNKVGGDGE